MRKDSNRDAARHVATGSEKADGHSPQRSPRPGLRMRFAVLLRSENGRSIRSAPRRPLRLTCAVPTPYHRRTIAVPSPYHGRFILGFQPKIRTNSGDGLRLVRRWLGDSVGIGGEGTAGAGGGIFALRRPRPYSRRLRGFRCDVCLRPPFATTWASMGTANGRVTTRRCKNRGVSLGGRREGGSRRGTPRHYVLREPGE